MTPMARAPPRAAAAPSRALRPSGRSLAALNLCLPPELIPMPANTIQKRRAADRSAALVRNRRKISYFRLVIAVRSTESLAMPVAPHQFELAPNALFPVTGAPPTVALKAPVKTLQSPLPRSESE